VVESQPISGRRAYVLVNNRAKTTHQGNCRSLFLVPFYNYRKFLDITTRDFACFSGRWKNGEKRPASRPYTLLRVFLRLVLKMLSDSPLRHPLHPGLQPPTRLCHSSIRNSACESPRVYLFSNLMPPCEIKRDRYNDKKKPVI
jgi:hypothetical protein